MTRGIRAIAAAAGLLALGVLVWEVHGRLTGDASRSRRAVASFGDRVASAARGPSAAQTPTLLVLPFENLGAEVESSTFLDGLADEILRDLARVEGLTVRSRYSSSSFPGPDRDLHAIAERLRANLVVTGTVLRSGDQVRVHAQLVDVVDDRPLWAERFDRRVASSADYLGLVDEIALRIANRLRLTLNVSRRRYDLDLSAYQKYLKARELTDRRGLVGPKKAVTMLDELIADDPTFAPAHAALADAYSFLAMAPYQSHVTAADGLERMRRAATRALELDPLLAEGHAAMGVVSAWDHDWTKAQESFERALGLDRTLTPIYTSYSLFVLRPLGRFDEAERLLLAALANDPLSLDLERELAEVLVSTGRYEEAIERLELVIAADDSFPFAQKFLGRTLVLVNRAEEGLALLQADEVPGQSTAQFQAFALMKLGRRAEVERLAVENERFALRLVYIYTALGEHDRAFAALERAAGETPPRALELLTNPELAPLHDDPRMVPFRRRFNLPDTPNPPPAEV